MNEYLFTCPNCHIQSEVVPTYNKEAEETYRSMEDSLNKAAKSGSNLAASYMIQRIAGRYNHIVECKVCGYEHRYWSTGICFLELNKENIK